MQYKCAICVYKDSPLCEPVNGTCEDFKPPAELEQALAVVYYYENL